MYDLDRLAHDIATHGIDRYEEDVQRLASYAYRRGIASVIVGVLADPSQPTVARERAFARVVAADRLARDRMAVA
ncbi:MAG TPA: hypothetical protein VLB67_10710 [Acidimicrobiia bacterium]|nr:hypothetical protein [Acidimicrobiia bacterium]